MLGWFAELMPLFMVRWLASRICERVTTSHTARPALVFATARRDVLVIVERQDGEPRAV